MSQKIPVAVLGATGSVGQRFIQLLENHPWFEVKEVAASERSAGKPYKEAVNWVQSTPIPESVKNLTVKNCEPGLESKVTFSGLDSSIAGEVETAFASKGYAVISNSKNHRMDKDVPLLVPEINPDHLQLVKYQKYNGGLIVTNPNCSTIGMVLALKPLADAFGLELVNVVTMQGLSGAGYPGVSSLDIIDNVIPFIGGEEPKMESEPLKILGEFDPTGIKNIDIKISAQCNRVGVIDGHTECVQVKLKKKASIEEVKKAWINFSAEPQKLKLPFAPENPIYYFEEEKYPQPRIHRNLDKGMAVATGRLREDKLFDYKFIVLSHNTIRGAAGGAILCGELMKAKGII
ncbi:MAG: aspartate-semialdehyde dehydrogenase [Ignavibacteria bacterium GWA2_35_9]|nr:MAG: aspartate-semialdehyde dehydrogenase [Ignavibacteria bacterium GWA2_35_9]OGU49257.1 MAG: aspartate-semialdehyde dehydrogenase [Ignavibacteria bacterium GWC2_36_12]